MTDKNVNENYDNTENMENMEKHSITDAEMKVMKAWLKQNQHNSDRQPSFEEITKELGTENLWNKNVLHMSVKPTKPAHKLTVFGLFRNSGIIASFIDYLRNN